MKEITIRLLVKNSMILISDIIKLLILGKRQDRRVFRIKYGNKFKKFISVIKMGATMNTGNQSGQQNFSVVDDKLVEWIKSLKNPSAEDVDIIFCDELWHSNELEISNRITYVPNCVSCYITYMTKSANFEILNQDEAFEIDYSLEYSFEYTALTQGDIQVTLMVVSYSDSQKIRVYSINSASREKLVFHPHEKYIRLAFKVVGAGCFTIDKLKMYREIKSTSSARGRFLNSLHGDYIERSKSYKDLSVAVITDRFTTECLSYEFNIVEFTPENWEVVLKEQVVDALFIESAWKGFNDTWEYKIGKYANQDKTPLIELISWCKLNDIPTIFWNKEDPIHFEKFIDTAKLCDYVYTTDENKVEEYKKRCGHTRVASLMFSAQPRIHNPIKIFDERVDKFCFAGSYYGNRHKDRREDMDKLLDRTMIYGLDIFDRNYEKTKNNSDSPFAYPTRFKNCIKGSLSYAKIDIAYKGYKYMLNVNSVKKSPTMFSRRIFEGLASGTPIVTTYSVGINRLFYDIVVEQNCIDSIDKLVNDVRYYRTLSIKGIREVLLKHTYKHRFYEVFKNVGIKLDEEREKSVCLLAYVKSMKDFVKVEESFNKQAYKNKEIVVFVDNFDGYIDLLNRYNSNSFRVFVSSYVRSHYSTIEDIIESDFIAVINSCNYYGQNYLVDLILSEKYADSKIIGKSSYFSGNDLKVVKELNEYEYVTDLRPDRSVIESEVFSKIEIDSMFEMLNTNDFNKIYTRKGIRMFSIDMYNFVENIDTDRSIINQVEV